MQRLSILVLVPLAASVGCVAETGGEAMVIRQNLAPGDSGCTFMPSPTAPFYSRGAIDLLSPVPYAMTPLIESRITAVMGQESQQTIALRGARVDLELGPISFEVNGAVQTNETTEIVKFRSLFSAPLAPNGGFSTAHFDVLPTTALATIRGKLPAGAIHVHAQAVATVVVYGDLGGDEVEGVPFVYPVTVCDDCVVNVLSATCPLPMGTTVRTGNVCNPFQDGVVDCCGAGAGLRCPATVSTTPPT